MLSGRDEGGVKQPRAIQGVYHKRWHVHVRRAWVGLARAVACAACSPDTCMLQGLATPPKYTAQE